MDKKKVKKIINRKKTVSKDDIAITNAINNKIVEETKGYVDNVFVKPEGTKKTTKVKQYIDDFLRKPKNG